MATPDLGIEKFYYYKELQPVWMDVYIYFCPGQHPCYGRRDEGPLRQLDKNKKKVLSAQWNNSEPIVQLCVDGM